MLPVDFEKLLREGDLSQNIYLQPDDFVYLPSTGIQVVYVLGAVLQPRAISFSGRPTLISTIASAGGTIKDAYLSQVAIVRGSLAQPEMAMVDYHAIARGKGSDIELQPGDIVYVPYAPYRTPLRYANLILDTFARTMGVNEGAHAITNSGSAVGVNVSCWGRNGLAGQTPTKGLARLADSTIRPGPLLGGSAESGMMGGIMRKFIPAALTLLSSLFVAFPVRGPGQRG